LSERDSTTVLTPHGFDACVDHAHDKTSPDENLRLEALSALAREGVPEAGLERTRTRPPPERDEREDEAWLTNVTEEKKLGLSFQ
jgi:uncharacterized protein YktB (UPF0637 family)